MVKAIVRLKDENMKKLFLKHTVVALALAGLTFFMVFVPAEVFVARIFVPLVGPTILVFFPVLARLEIYGATCNLVLGMFHFIYCWIFLLPLLFWFIKKRKRYLAIQMSVLLIHVVLAFTVVRPWIESWD